MTFNPKQKALAFRIWAYAKPRGWNCTIAEIADALDVAIQPVINALRYEGWMPRIPKTQTSMMQSDRVTGGMSWLDRPARNQFDNIRRLEANGTD